MSPEKNFKLKKEQIERLIPKMGACIASDMITVDGHPVGYMYREKPDSGDDSGWRFFSGNETEEYSQDSANFGVYEVNTICNYDRSIIPHLEAPFGTSFFRDPRTGALVREALNPPE